MQHICTHDASVSMSAWRKCAETVPWGLNTTYMQTPIYIRQTGLPFLSLSYFQHYSVCFTWNDCHTEKKYIYVLFHVKRTALFAIKQLMYWNRYFDLESRFTLFSIQCLWSQITTHHIKHINNDVKRMDGIIFFSFLACFLHIHASI